MKKKIIILCNSGTYALGVNTNVKCQEKPRHCKHLTEMMTNVL